MKLRYLHLSDLHFDGSKKKEPARAFDQDTVTKKMLECILLKNWARNLRKKSTINRLWQSIS